MSTAAVAEPVVRTLPQWKARAAGLSYLICGTAYTFAEGTVRGKLVVWGDAGATARNILDHQTLYRLGFAAELISVLGYVVVTLLLYQLLKPVSRNISLSAAVFSLVGCILQGATSLLHLAPLVLLGNSFGALSREQMEGFALVCLKLRAESVSLYMVFFAWYCLLLGYLIFRSKFMPRVIGIFLMIAGVCYQIFFWPPLAARLFHYIVMPAGVLGELSLIAWLLVFGVNPQRWREQAREAGMRV